MLDMEELIARGQESGASDIHIVCGLPVKCRVDGSIRSLTTEPLSHEDCEVYARALAGDEYAAMERIGELDLSRSFLCGARTRINLFRQRGAVSAAIRILADHIPELEELELPPVVSEFPDYRSGIVLVTGETGSGKSTTLATMIDRINHTRNAHIVTIEDPVEFVHRSDRCIVNQRQIGRDAPSFNNALVAALRQDPDVILVGEIRDLETIRTALQAAETGHLVLTTLHAGDCAGAIERLVGVFPADEQASVRQQLALVLRGIFAQHLVRRADGDGRVPVCELLVNNPAISNFIVTGRSQQVYSAMEVGGPYGMCTIDQSLNTLLDAGLITVEAARALSKNPQQYG